MLDYMDVDVKTLTLSAAQREVARLRKQLAAWRHAATAIAVCADGSSDDQTPDRLPRLVARRITAGDAGRLEEFFRSVHREARRRNAREQARRARCR